MARKVQVVMIDDLDGSSQAEKTVSFALDGVSYEIDLSTTNAERLRTTLAPWIPYARKSGRKNPRSRTLPQRSTRPTDIRKWARQNGYTVSERGKIPGKVLTAYQQATT